ncbi:MAG: hypothetical protein M3P94_06330, partial [Chloroflexota bacterium]|nr:hypothetical protein [Chloroflexota bacterium]
PGPPGRSRASGSVVRQLVDRADRPAGVPWADPVDRCPHRPSRRVAASAARHHGNCRQGIPGDGLAERVVPAATSTVEPAVNPGAR